MCGGGSFAKIGHALGAGIVGLGYNYMKDKKKSSKRKARERAAAVSREAERVKSKARAKAKDRTSIQTIYSVDPSQNIMGGGYGD